MRTKNNLSALDALRQTQGQFSMNVLRVASASQDGETVTIGSNVYEIDTTVVAGVTAGRVRVNCSGGSTAAAIGTLTLTDIPHADDTVIVGTVTYTFKSSVTTTANQVKIGDTAEASIDNLVAAINKAAGGGTTYGSATVANPEASAAKATAATMAATARIPGTVGNAVDSAGSMTHGSWGTAHLASGVDPTAGETSDALITAINANTAEVVDAFDIGANEVLVVHNALGINALACTETLGGSNNAWASATMYGGAVVTEPIKIQRLMSRAPLSTEVTMENMHFYFPFAPVHAIALVRVTSGGAAKAWDGALTITGNRVTLDNSGSTDWATTDTVTVLASM